MIGSFTLAVLLFATASLGWSVVFLSSRNGDARKFILAVYFLLTASSVFASIFFIRGLADAGAPPGLVISSLVFALSFILSLLCGFLLTGAIIRTALPAVIEGLWKSERTEKPRSEALDEIIERIAETGEIDALEKELIGSILRFKDKIVREVMIPRGDIVAINVEENPRNVLRRVAEEGYSRMPVFSGSIDNIVGIIYAKDLIPMAEGGGTIVLQDILRSPYYVPESKKISQLLREMQRNKVHLAIVVDEFGGTEGIVTLEDVLEEIVGEIQDEYDESLSELTRDDDGDVHFSGSMSVDRFDELLEVEIPREEDYDTMAGFVQKLAGKLPQKGEVYNYGEMFFIIEDVARHRIKRLKVSFKEHPRIDLPVEPEKRERLDTGTAAAEAQPVDEEFKEPPRKKSSASRSSGKKSPRAGQKPRRQRTRKDAGSKR